MSLYIISSLYIQWFRNLLPLLSTVAPQILDLPDNLTVVEPQNATFSCLATGRPRPDIIWIRLSDMVQLHTQSAGFTFEEQEIGDRERRSNLTILGTQPSDADVYICMAINEPGTAIEQTTLTIHGEPMTKLAMTMVHIFVGVMHHEYRISLIRHCLE